MSTASNVQIVRNMTLASRITPTRRQPKPGKYDNVRSYRQRWYRPSGPVLDQLRAKYGNNRDRYFLSYQPNDEDIVYFQEAGIRAFTKMERQLLRRMRLGPYYNSGTQAIESLGAVLSPDGPNSERPNMVFVSLDFEYWAYDPKQSISEFGFATIDSEQLLSPRDTSISTSNFTLRYKGNGERKFRFGSSTRLLLELRERTIVDIITKISHEDPQSQIILVGQNVVSEIRVLDEIGLPVEDLPIAGIIDTCHLARDVLGLRGSLMSLLSTLMIPFRPNLLHCAGNDAHFTPPGPTRTDPSSSWRRIWKTREAFKTRSSSAAMWPQGQSGSRLG